MSADRSTRGGGINFPPVINQERTNVARTCRELFQFNETEGVKDVELEFVILAQTKLNQVENKAY